MLRSLVGSEMCIRDRWYQRRVRDTTRFTMSEAAAVEEPVTVVLGDPLAVKNALDEHIPKVIEEVGFKEDMGFDNIKLLLGTIACCFGVFGQFHVWFGFPDFPFDRSILLMCSFGYMVFSSAMTAQIFFNGTCLLRVVSPEGGFSGMGDMGCLKGIKSMHVHSYLPRFGTDFQLSFVIQTVDGASYSSSTTEGLKAVENVGKFFTVDGDLVQVGLSAWIKSALVGAAKAVAASSNMSKQKSS
eukprot:TRINITY_DN26264_c0_g1_i1.p1 TRINITY_DN26264_c0_g1~~TRINITY_DN26264_c0_g1_i1.p1  ORF type:complete len:242 (-),score=78.72 TRINITY_DN26264_c0_g1_i1:486-1211(-)